MADDNIIQRIILEGAELAKKQLEDIGNAGERAFGRVGDSASSAAPKMERAGKSAEDTAARLKAVEAAAHRFGGSIRDVGDSFVGMGRGVLQGAQGIVAFADKLKDAGVAVLKFTAVVGAIPTAMFAAAKAAANHTSEIKDAATAAGADAEKFQELSFAVSQSGGSAQTFSRAMGIINAAAGEAIEKGERSAGAFKKLGVDLADAAGNARDPVEVFQDIADKISKIEDPATRAATAAAVFGRRLGPQLAESLSLGRKGLKELGDEAFELGITLTKKELEVGEDLGDSFDKFAATAKSAFTRVGLAFAPLVKTILENSARIITHIEAITPAIQSVAETIEPVIQDLFYALAGETDRIKSPFIRVFGEVAKQVVIFMYHILKSIKDVLTEAYAIIDTFAKGINAVFGTAFKGGDLIAFAAAIYLAWNPLTKLFGVVTSAFNLLGTTARALGPSLASLVTSSGGLSGAFAGVRVALAPLVAMFGPWGIVIIAVTAAMGALFAYLTKGMTWAEVGTKIMDVWKSVETYVVGLFASLQEKWNAFTGFFSNIGAGIGAAWDQVIAYVSQKWNEFLGLFPESWRNAFEAIKNFAADAFNFMFGWIGRLLTGVRDYIRELQRAKAVSADSPLDLTKTGRTAAQMAGTVGGTGYAFGGEVWGPGTSRSDSILARLSRGEFVVQAAAVRKYGKGLLHLINSLRFDPRSLRGFATGGFVDIPAPMRFAGGGEVRERGGRTVNLSIGGEIFENLFAPEDTAEKLIKFATKRQVASAGRKPSYMGAAKR